MDSSSKKSDTPQLPFSNTKSTEDSNENRRKNWKLNNLSLHKKQDSIQLTTTEIYKFHTPQINANMNLTFNRGVKFGDHTKVKNS